MLFHGNCLDILPTLETDSVDLVCTDPYSEWTHEGARSAKDVDKTMIDFKCTDGDTIRRVFVECGWICKTWIIATMDWRHIYQMSEKPPNGLRFVRFGIWVKPNGAPQFTGDRPGPGWEGIAFLHREGGKMNWNGGGNSSVFIENKRSTARIQLASQSS